MTCASAWNSFRKLSASSASLSEVICSLSTPLSIGVNTACKSLRMMEQRSSWNNSQLGKMLSFMTGRGWLLTCKKRCHKKSSNLLTVIPGRGTEYPESTTMSSRVARVPQFSLSMLFLFVSTAFSKDIRNQWRNPAPLSLLCNTCSRMAANITADFHSVEQEFELNVGFRLDRSVGSFSSCLLMCRFSVLFVA